jgi:hypothetical protein
MKRVHPRQVDEGVIGTAVDCPMNYLEMQA